MPFAFIVGQVFASSEPTAHVAAKGAFLNTPVIAGGYDVFTTTETDLRGDG